MEREILGLKFVNVFSSFYFLDKAIGDMLRNGEDVEIVDIDLSEIY